MLRLLNVCEKPKICLVSMNQNREYPGIKLTLYQSQVVFNKLILKLCLEYIKINGIHLDAKKNNDVTIVLDAKFEINSSFQIFRIEKSRNKKVKTVDLRFNHCLTTKSMKKHQVQKFFLNTDRKIINFFVAIKVHASNC